MDDIRSKIGRRDYTMKKTMVDTEVTYTLEHDGKFYIIEHVPARVCQETGEQYFAPETVERLQALVKRGGDPAGPIRFPLTRPGVYPGPDE